MRSGGGGGGIAGNPVLIGAATVLVVIVAVFLSYNANQGLPFVPTYQLKAQTPSAANLVRGNEVRIGGTRVGSVDTITAERREDGTSIAVLGLKLERSVSPLPKDSTVLIRPRSALGLKYVELTRGTSEEGFEDGDTIPLAPGDAGAGRVRRVREHVRRGHARRLADQPAAASATRSRAAARASTRRSARSGRCCATPSRCCRTSRARRRTCRASSASWPTPRGSSRPPPRRRRSCSSTSTARSRALREVSRPYIQESISEGPETLDAAIRGFPVQRPFLANTEGLFRELRPGVRALRGAAPDLADALEIGTPTLRRTPALNRRLASLLQELERFAAGPAGAARDPPPDRHGADAEPDAAVPRAGADDLQLRRALVPQHRLAAVRGRRQRHLAALHHRRDAAGPEQRGRPVVRAGQRARRPRTTCTRTRTRTPPRRASRASARRATRPTCRARP